MYCNCCLSFLLYGSHFETTGYIFMQFDTVMTVIMNQTKSNYYSVKRKGTSVIGDKI